MTPVPWILIALGGLLAWTPKWTRPDLFFSVTVQTDFAYTEPARRIVRRYWLEIALHTLIAIAIAALAGMENAHSVLFGVGWLVFGSGWAVARGYRATRQYAARPSPVREAAFELQPDKLAGGWAFALAPVVFVALAAVYAWIFWERLPERIPVHWGFQGADRWVDRTPFHVFGYLALLASYCVVFLLLWYGIERWSRTISATGVRAQRENRFRRATIWLLLGSQYLVVIPAVLLSFGAGAGGRIWPILSIVVTVAALIVLIRMGQGGSRRVDTAEYQPPIGDRTPDDAWKWGLFYYNPDDPAIVVEKRFGLGYTFNYGNVWSWVVTVALLVPVALAVAFL